MFDWDIFNSCSHIEHMLDLMCSESSTRNSEHCKNIRRYIMLSKADCFMRPLFLLITAILIVLGTVLNLFSLYCFLKMKKRNSQNIYLSVLSLGDTINLHLNFTLPLVRQWSTFDDSFRDLHMVCRLTGVLTEFFLIFPAWIVVLLTVERLVCILWPLRSRTSFMQTRAKISILTLAIIVIGLSVYRIWDIKGIDQISAFKVVACNGTDKPKDLMRNFNLITWTILPVCFTLILNLVIIYEIKLAAQKLEPIYSKLHQNKYNQATKIVLLISILFLILHTPTGIVFTVDLIYGTHENILVSIILQLARKLTVILYEISLCCKFFIYNRTFRNFKSILHTSLSGFTRRTNSAKIGRPVLASSHGFHQHRTYHFSTLKQSVTSPTSQSDSFVKHTEDNHNIISNRQQRTSSISLSRKNREQQPLAVTISKSNDVSYVALPKTPNLLRRHTTKKDDRYGVI